MNGAPVWGGVISKLLSQIRLTSNNPSLLPVYVTLYPPDFPGECYVCFNFFLLWKNVCMPRDCMGLWFVSVVWCGKGLKSSKRNRFCDNVCCCIARCILRFYQDDGFFTESRGRSCLVCIYSTVADASILLWRACVNSVYWQMTYVAR